MLIIYIRSLKKKGYLVHTNFIPMPGKLAGQIIMVPTHLIITEDGEFGSGSSDDLVPILSLEETTALRQAKIPLSTLEEEKKEDPNVDN